MGDFGLSTVCHEEIRGKPSIIDIPGPTSIRSCLFDAIIKLYSVERRCQEIVVYTQFTRIRLIKNLLVRIILVKIIEYFKGLSTFQDYSLETITWKEICLIEYVCKVSEIAMRNKCVIFWAQKLEAVDLGLSILIIQVTLIDPFHL